MIEPTKRYKYLGILLDSNEKFKSAMDDLAKKGMRVSHTIYKLSTCNFISHATLIETFLIKPIVLVSSEILGYEIKPDCTQKNPFRDSANTSWGELGAFPL